MVSTFTANLNESSLNSWSTFKWAKKKWKLRWVLFFFSLMGNGLVWFTSRIRQNHPCSKSFTGESSEALSGQFGRLMIRKSETMNDR
uniref:Uncharacterized protein n=1 Tax=Populus trichocarpa TaxID=3694 RepID=A0A2K2A8H9_POPTR